MVGKTRLAASLYVNNLYTAQALYSWAFENRMPMARPGKLIAFLGKESSAARGGAHAWPLFWWAR